MRNNYLDVLKFLAIFVMLIDHIAYLLLPSDLIVVHHMRGIGRLAMPLFFSVHGYLLMKSTHPPRLARIAKFAFYGTFLTICCYTIPIEGETQLLINVLLQFALLEALHRLSYTLRLHSLILPFLLVAFLSVLNITANFEDFFAAGVYPLLYGLSGMMLAFSKNHTIQKLATLLLVVGLSFEYNPIITLLYLYTTDSSFIFYLLPPLCVPFLFWYIPKANIDLPTLRPVIQSISRNAIHIYIIHFQLLYIILLLINNF